MFTAPDADRWILKGAGALLARLPDARHSRDIDLAFTRSPTPRSSDTAQPLDDATASLRTALDVDLGDHFRFEISRISPLPETAKGHRVHVVAYLGPRYATFHVDVVVGTAMTGIPQPGTPLIPLDIPGLQRPTYRLFPLADHVADKLCAIIEIHPRADGARPSTRVKDLVDLVLIAQTQSLDADQLTAAVRLGAAHRGLTLPRHLSVPDTPLWRRGYPDRAHETPSAIPDFDAAVTLVAELLDPILNGAATGTWNPHTSQWIPNSLP
jgi:hypothetical protein